MTTSTQRSILARAPAFTMTPPDPNATSVNFRVSAARSPFDSDPLKLTIITGAFAMIAIFIGFVNGAVEAGVIAALIVVVVCAIIGLNKKSQRSQEDQKRGPLGAEFTVSNKGLSFPDARHIAREEIDNLNIFNPSTGLRETQTSYVVGSTYYANSAVGTATAVGGMAVGVGALIGQAARNADNRDRARLADHSFQLRYEMRGRDVSIVGGLDHATAKELMWNVAKVMQLASN